MRSIVASSAGARALISKACGSYVLVEFGLSVPFVISGQTVSISPLIPGMPWDVKPAHDHPLGEGTVRGWVRG